MPNLPEKIRVEPSVSLSYSSPSKIGGGELNVKAEEEGRTARLQMSGEVKETTAAATTTVCTTVPGQFRPTVGANLVGLVQEGPEGSVTTKPIMVVVTTTGSILFSNAPELKEGTGFTVNATYQLVS